MNSLFTDDVWPVVWPLVATGAREFLGMVGPGGGGRDGRMAGPMPLGSLVLNFG